MKKLYIISVNDDLTLDKVAFHNHIKSLYPITISAWWHYLKGSTYIVQSKLKASEIYNMVYPGIPKRQFMVIEINGSNKQGWLPKAAWEWINKHKP